MKWLTLTRKISCSFAAVALAAFACRVSAQTANGVSAAPTLSTEQILERMHQHDQAQKAALEHYQALRHYAVEYRGFLKTIKAKMDVEINYDAASGKSFRIVSESGSHTLCQKVLERAVDSEKEASLNRGETALTEANYKFRLAGADNLSGRSAYILDVEPISPSKFLYRGRIWVDAVDFAVARMEVQPAKSPSFWISQTLIHHTSAETGGFWLPQKIRSETKVRIGGTAVMTIDYGEYQLVPRSSPSMISDLR